MFPKSTNLWLAQSFRVQATFSLVILRAEVCRLQAKQERLSTPCSLLQQVKLKKKEDIFSDFYQISLRGITYSLNCEFLLVWLGEFFCSRSQIFSVTFFFWFRTEVPAGGKYPVMNFWEYRVQKKRKTCPLLRFVCFKLFAEAQFPALKLICMRCPTRGDGTFCGVVWWVDTILPGLAPPPKKNKSLPVSSWKKNFLPVMAGRRRADRIPLRLFDSWDPLTSRPLFSEAKPHWQ